MDPVVERALRTALGGNPEVAPDGASVNTSGCHENDLQKIAGMLNHLAESGYTWELEDIKAWAKEFAEEFNLGYPFGEVSGILAWTIDCADVIAILHKDDYAFVGRHWADEAIEHYSSGNE